MIPGSRARNLALAGGLATVLACGVALAQTAGPVELAPLRLTPEAAPGALAPSGPRAPAIMPPGSTLAQETPADAPPAIEIGELDTLDPDSGGTLEESMGGLGVAMWSGTPRATIERLLPQLPNELTSPGLHDLARRLLLTTAIAPRGEADSRGASLIGLRVEKLGAMGLTGAVVDLVGIAPSRDTDPALVRATIDSRLAFDDVAGACEAEAPARKVFDGLYWRMVAIFCQAVAGDSAAAAFETNVLADSGDLDDPAFFAMAETLTSGGKADLDSLSQPTLLHLAMSRAVDATLPSDVLETGSATILRAIADVPNVSEDVRLEAAERAAAVGAAGPRWLAEKYAAVEFSDEDLSKAISRAEEERTPRVRALLYQAASLQSLPVTRAAVMQKAWEIAEEDGNYLLMARLYLPLLEEIDASGELVWFAADAARTLFVMRRPAEALAWAGLLRRFAREPEHRAMARLLWPIARLTRGTGSAGGFGSPAHREWIETLREVAGADANRRIGLAYLLLEALGEAPPEEYWRALLDGVARTNAMVPDPAYLRAFRRAARGGRRGETVMLALLVLGSGGTENAGADVVAEIVIGLHRVGLDDDARQIAMEAALRGGL
jgi:hypothetical protein